MKVGFIGTGRMGQAMVRRLLDAKHDVGVYNRTAEKAKPLADAGAKILPSVAEAARYGEVIYTMLADDTALEDVIFQQGLLAALPKGEGFALTRKYGVDTAVFYDVMTDGLFNCSAYKVYGKIMVDESYSKVGQMAVLGLKDANLALEAGFLAAVPLPSGNVWRDRLVGAVAHGDGDKDWAVMALEQARASGLA